MEKFVYIMSCQRGKRLPEIHYICDNYNEAIKVYYNYYIDNHNYDFLEDPECTYWFMYLYKIPLSVNFKEGEFSFKEGEFSMSKVKLGKSSEYRVEFDTWGDLTEEYKITNRNKAIDEVLD